MLRPNDTAPLPDRLWLDLREASTATLSTALARRGLRSVCMLGPRPLRPGSRCAGEAYTLRLLPTREDLGEPSFLADPEYPQRHAVETVGPGQVLVVDARGVVGAGVLGDILARRIAKRGAVGLVTDGAVRDAAGVAAAGIPVFACGAHPLQHTAVHIAADEQLPIQCGGILVLPGDIIAGDDDGVLVIPRPVAVEVAADAAEQERLEQFVMMKIEDGSPIRGVYPPDEATRAEYEAQRRL
jgi:regulator of RNase E activity RraA